MFIVSQSLTNIIVARGKTESLDLVTFSLNQPNSPHNCHMILFLVLSCWSQAKHRNSKAYLEDSKKTSCLPYTEIIQKFKLIIQTRFSPIISLGVSWLWRTVTKQCEVPSEWNLHQCGQYCRACNTAQKKSKIFPAPSGTFSRAGSHNYVIKHEWT